MLLVFLILAAQYESWALPLAIVLIVPMCLLSSLLGVRLSGWDNNVLTQIGFIVLVGLACKNAILIVEFARERVEQGMGVIEAAIEACRLRLRPILMTSFAFIMGVVPLVTATGAGSELRRAMGIAVFSGMLGVTLFGLFLTPVFFVTIELALRRKRRCRRAGCDARGANVKRPCAYHAHSGRAGRLRCRAELSRADAVGAGPTSATQRSRESAKAKSSRSSGRCSTILCSTDWSAMRWPQTRISRKPRAICRLRAPPRALTGFDAFPTVTASGFYTRARVSGDQLPGATREQRTFDTYDVGFDAAWELDLFGRVRRSKEAARADVGSAEATLRDAIVSVTAEVARNYCVLRGLQDQLAVAERNEVNQRQTLDLTQVRLDAGRGTQLDVSRAAAQLATTEATIPPLRISIATTIHRLSVLTGRQPDVLTPELSASRPMPALPELNAISGPEALLRRRPDVRIAERNLAAATARIGVSVADLFPRITLIGSAGYDSAIVA